MFIILDDNVCGLFPIGKNQHNLLLQLKTRECINQTNSKQTSFIEFTILLHKLYPIKQSANKKCNSCKHNIVDNVAVSKIILDIYNVPLLNVPSHLNFELILGECR